jgi:hypothetical protein
LTTKKVKKKAAAATAGAAAVSLCDQGTEINRSFINVRPNEIFEVLLVVCGSPAMAVVDFDGQRHLSQVISGPVAVRIQAPPVPGEHLLVWGVAPLASPWRAKGEVNVGGAILFCNKKNSASSHPVPKWGLGVRVVA